MTNLPRAIAILVALIGANLTISARAADQQCGTPPIETNTNEFQVYIESNNILGVEQYLQTHNVNLSGMFKNCTTPLDKAVDTKHPEMVSFLISHGAQINQLDGQSAMALHRAAHFNNPSMVAFLISKGAQVDALGQADMMPLHYAASAGSLEAAEALLKAGANIDGNDAAEQRRGQSSPLQSAIASRHKDVAQLLIAHGANVNTLDVWQETALYGASQNKGWSDIVRQIIDNGAECEAVHNNAAAIDYAADPESIRLLVACVSKRTGKAPDLNKALNLAVLFADKERIQALLSAGANIHAVKPIGLSQNKLASLAFTQFLLDLGADPNGRDNNRTTALQSLAFRDEPESVEIAKILIARGAKVDDSALGPTPLFGAARSGHVEMATLLLDEGANPNQQSVELKTPLSVAIENNHPAMANLLLNRGADPNLLNGLAISAAAAQGPLDLLSKMLKNSGNPNGWSSAEPSGYTLPPRPLIQAVANANLEAARLLLDAGADPNSAALGDGMTPLHFAAKTDQIDMARLLVSHKADPALASRQGLWPENMTSNPAILALLKGSRSRAKKEINPLIISEAAFCNKFAKLLNNSTQTPDIREGGDETGPVLSPLDDWGPESGNAQITGQIKVSGANFLSGTNSLLEIFVARVDHSGQARLVCLIAEKVVKDASTKDHGAELVALNPVEQYLTHSKAAHAPLTYAFARFGTRALALVLAKRDQEPELAYLKGDLGSLALLYAAIAKGHVDGVAYLLDHNVSPNPSPELLQSDYDSKTPLSELFQVDDLLSRGALTTPLGFAAENRQFMIAKLLLERGANPNSGNTYGAKYAPLYSAASHQDIKMAKLFLDHGADALGANAAFFILQNGHQVELLQILKDYGFDQLEAREVQAANCESFSSDSMPLTCLPRILKSTQIALEKRTAALRGGEGSKDKLDVAGWENTRDRACGVQLNEIDRDGWISYLLSDTKRAKCVLNKTRQHIAALAPK